MTILPAFRVPSIQFGALVGPSHKKLVITEDGTYPVGDGVRYYTAVATSGMTPSRDQAPERITVDFYPRMHPFATPTVNPFYRLKFIQMPGGPLTITPEVGPHAHGPLSEDAIQVLEHDAGVLDTQVRNNFSTMA